MGDRRSVRLFLALALLLTAGPLADARALQGAGSATAASARKGKAQQAAAAMATTTTTTTITSATLAGASDGNSSDGNGPASSELCVSLLLEGDAADKASFARAGYCGRADATATAAAADNNIVLLQDKGFAQASCSDAKLRTCALVELPQGGAGALRELVEPMLFRLANLAAAGTLCGQLATMDLGLAAEAQLDGQLLVAAGGICPSVFFPPPERFPTATCKQDAYASPFVVDKTITSSPGRASGATWFCWRLHQAASSAMAMTAAGDTGGVACAHSAGVKRIEFLLNKAKKSRVTGVMVRGNGLQPKLSKPVWGSAGSLRVTMDLTTADVAALQPEVCLEVSGGAGLRDMCQQSGALGAGTQPLCWAALVDPTGACCPTFLAQQQQQVAGEDPAK